MDIEKFLQFHKDLEKSTVAEKEAAKVQEYQTQNKVGFVLKGEEAEFISAPNSFNRNWILNYNDITGIAFGSKRILDDDEFYILIIQGNKKLIQFWMPGYPSAEIVNLELFINELKQRIKLRPISWEYDKTKIAFPESLRGELLYKSRARYCLDYLVLLIQGKNTNHARIKNALKAELKVDK